MVCSGGRRSAKRSAAERCSRPRRSPTAAAGSAPCPGASCSRPSCRQPDSDAVSGEPPAVRGPRARPESICEGESPIEGSLRGRCEPLGLGVGGRLLAGLRVDIAWSVTRVGAVLRGLAAGLATEDHCQAGTGEYPSASPCSRLGLVRRPRALHELGKRAGHRPPSSTWETGYCDHAVSC